VNQPNEYIFKLYSLSGFQINLQSRPQFYKRKIATRPKTAAAKVLATVIPFAALPATGDGVELAETVAEVEAEVTKVLEALGNIPPGWEEGTIMPPEAATEEEAAVSVEIATEVGAGASVEADACGCPSLI
jgi:hypothetical protein